MTNPFRLAMNVKARRVGKHIGIVIGRKRRRADHHALEDRCAADLGIARGDPRESEIAVAGKTKALLQRVRNERRIVDELPELIRVGVEQIERTAGRPARRRQRGATDAENLVEQFAVAEFVTLIAGVDEIADEIASAAFRAAPR